MKKILFLLCICLSGTNMFAQTFLWAKKMGGTGQYDGATFVTTDAVGNVYTTGSFQGTVDFDPGPGVYNLTVMSAQSADIFISKLDASGNFVWAKSFGSSTDATNTGYSVSTDAAGNLYTTGVFYGTIDFDPGPATYNLTAPMASGFNSTALFILKLDANGNFIWARSTSDPVVWAWPVKLDAVGNCYVSGTVFGNTIDFDPGPGIYNLNFPTGYGCFLLKLDPDGNFIWAKGFDGSIFFNGFSLLLDTNNNIYLSGGFTGTVDFDPGAGTFSRTSSGWYDAFITKLDPAGNLLWAHTFGNTDLDFGRETAIDGAGNIYLIGQFRLSSDFDPGPGGFNLTSAGSDDFFLIKLTPTGDFIWGKSIGGTGSDVGFSLGMDVAGKINLCGNFSNVVDFDPGPGTLNLTSAGNADIFLARYDTSGNILSAQSFGGAGDDVCYSLALDQSSNLFLAGNFSQTADFDPGAGVYNLTSDGGSDIFVLKAQLSTLPVTLLNFNVTKNNDDAVLNWQTSSELNADRFEIERSDEGSYFKKIGEVKAFGNSNTIKTYQFIDTDAGAAFTGKTIYYRLKQIDNDDKFAISKVRPVTFGIHPVVTIYPNPTNDFINIETDASKIGLKYIITDATGKKIILGQLNSVITVVHIRQIPAGIYFITIEKTGKSIRITKN